VFSYNLVVVDSAVWVKLFGLTIREGFVICKLLYLFYH